MALGGAEWARLRAFSRASSGAANWRIGEMRFDVGTQWYDCKRDLGEKITLFSGPLQYTRTAHCII